MKLIVLPPPSRIFNFISFREHPEVQYVCGEGEWCVSERERECVCVRVRACECACVSVSVSVSRSVSVCLCVGVGVGVRVCMCGACWMSVRV